MAANKPYDPKEQRLPDLSDPAQRFEKRDVDFRALTKFGIGLVILCISSFLLLIGIFKFLLDQENSAQKPRTGIHADLNRRPPEPRLQSQPVKDLAAVRAEEEAILSNYTWVDKEKGVVRIPIDRAIDLLVQKGLPARTQAPASLSAASVPTEAGMGDIMQREGGPLAAELNAAPAESHGAAAAPKAVPAKPAEKAPVAPEAK